MKTEDFTKEQKIEIYQHYVGEYLHGRVDYPDLTSEQHMRTFEHFWRTPNTDYFIDRWWKLPQQNEQKCGYCSPDGTYTTGSGGEIICPKCSGTKKPQSSEVETGTSPMWDDEQDEGFISYFKIDNQTFYVGNVDTKEHAEWTKGCLDTAFAKLSTNQDKVREAAEKVVDYALYGGIGVDLHATITELEKALNQKQIR